MIVPAEDRRTIRSLLENGEADAPALEAPHRPSMSYRDLVALADRDGLRRWLAARVPNAACVEVEFGHESPW